MGAVGAVSVLLGAFREGADDATGLMELCECLERALAREQARRGGEAVLEGFVTAVIGEIGPDDGTIRLLNRGHPPPYLLADGAVSTLDPAVPDLPLGMGTLRQRVSPPDTFTLSSGTTLLLVTDGVTEARDGVGVFYDPAEGLAGAGPFPQPEDVIDALVEDVERWSGDGGADDMAILAVRYR